MKDKENRFEELNETSPVMDEEQKRRTAKRGSIAVILILLALVTVISFIMYFIEINFGKTAGTVALIIMAVLIAVYLYRNEIREKLKRK